MKKYLLKNVWILLSVVAVAFVACKASKGGSNTSSHNNHETISSGFHDVDTVNIVQNIIPTDQQAKSLMDLPATQDGGYILSPGFYEADFKSFCLQPGTPDPGSRDAYFRAPLTGYRKDIIETILRNSERKPNLEQKNVQLLLWSVVSKSSFDNLSYPVQATARELLTPKQIFELKGGTMGVVKTFVKTSGITNVNSDLQNLFELGSSSYEIYEQVAVLRQPSKISRPDFKRDQWYKQPEGYYVRYFPNGYKNVKIQVYAPEACFDSTNLVSNNHIIFDPTSMVIVPAYSNAQRLGIGGPVVEIIRQVIKIEKSLPPPPPRKQPESKPTKQSKQLQ